MRVAELVRYSYPAVDSLINEGKKAFVKCGRRKCKYSEITHLSNPQEPVLTRWSTWLHAAFYYADNLTPFKQFINDQNKEESSAISKLVFASRVNLTSTLGLYKDEFFFTGNSHYKTRRPSLFVPKSFDYCRS